ncbi:hypothetical protein BD413DRAFT_613796 [Trametes elegans]|nr:hypothetical protein BD413DRAFT_613796 [Trametes elegans]
MAEVAVAAPIVLPPSLDPSARIDAPDSAADAQDVKAAQLASQEQAVEALAKPAHDPHVLPNFEKRSQSPILYLPPLLSSLPAGVRHPAYPDSSPAFSSPTAPRPLSTESRLPSIDQASLALHRALHSFRPITAEYAVTPYPDAFNWSKRREGSDGGPLYDADKNAHEEAVQNGGLILYWYGTPHPQTGLNLATCIWQSRAHAAAANSRPHHIRAMRLAAASYERYELNRLRLKKIKGETRLRIEPYDGGDVGW